MRGIELIEEATGITPKMKEITIEALRYASRQRRRSIRAASAQSADRSNEGATGPVEEVSQQLNVSYHLLSSSAMQRIGTLVVV